MTVQRLAAARRAAGLAVAVRDLDWHCSRAVSESIAARRVWAAMMLAPTSAVCRSILLGLPVQVRQLDLAAVRHALRGSAALGPAAWVTITVADLDAIAEAGRFPTVKRPR